MNDIQTIMGGVEMNAIFRPETKLAAEPVFVRALTIRLLPNFFKAAEDEAAMIEIACGKSKGWADHLTDESHLELLQKAKELNFSRALAWGERQVDAGKMLAPLMSKVMAQPPSA